MRCSHSPLNHHCLQRMRGGVETTRNALSRQRMDEQYNNVKVRIFSPSLRLRIYFCAGYTAGLPPPLTVSSCATCSKPQLAACMKRTFVFFRQPLDCQLPEMAYPMRRLPTTWQPSQTEFAEKPWKYIGYRFFSSLVASDDDSFVLRRFGTLTARVLLGLQDQLSRVEEDLEELEKRAREQDAPDMHNGSFRLETQEYRRDLVRQAQLLLREYSQLAFLYGSPIKNHLCDCVPREWNNARQIDIDTAYGTSHLILPSSRPLTFTL